MRARIRGGASASARLKVNRNSPKCLLLGASWSHDKSWGEPRRTHVYLGPFVLTITSGAR